MKSAMLLAASALLGSASAGVHKMKLKKVPLSEQLVRTSICPTRDPLRTFHQVAICLRRNSCNFRST
ncbi:hypothetical protein IWZ00DRAFT_513719 [Phyllosticta capitalensis]